MVVNAVQLGCLYIYQPTDIGQVGPEKNVNWSFGQQSGKMLLLYVITCDGY